MHIDVASTDVIRVYRLLIELVVPRPIAWVTTISSVGKVNLAPFSFFNAFGANPPIVVFSPTLRRDGSKKDTLRNVEQTGQFVVNLAVESLAHAVNQSSLDLPYGESEVELLNLELTPSTHVQPPRIAQAPAHLECKVHQIVSIGNGPIAANLVIGQVLAIHVDDQLLDPHGAVDPRKLQAIARLGGDYYCRSTDLFTLERPRL